MASARANPALIGAFVLGAAALLLLAVVLFSSGELFQEQTQVVAYFDSSVTGLDVGAPVIFRGVVVGNVERIGAVVDAETLAVAVPVYFDLIRDRVEVTGTRQVDREAGLHRFIESGLRAQLKSQSLITGKLYLDLDLHPNTEAHYKGLDPSVLEMPTIPTQFEVIQREIREVASRIAKLPLEDLVKSIASASRGLDRLLNKPELESSIERLDSTLRELQELITNLDGRIEAIADQSEAALGAVRDATRQAESALAAMETSIEPGSPLQYQLMSTLQELEAASRSFRQLSDALARNPEQVIYGKPKEDRRQ
jgi:paraquat-inducible protein B